jgi:integrase
MRRGTLQRAWYRARRAVGLPDFHFHDLRHTGNTLAAAAGASTKELMSRMGHASARAALIYQHAVRERDIAIAGALSDAIERVLSEPTVDPVQLPLLEPPIARRGPAGRASRRG